MATNPITELDFFRIKEQLKTYLREQDKFKDYDFDGSNISVLLDVLSYNTYQNNFYANMAISEMFLDSAQRENSVVSHAKELNYLPRSDKSAKAIIDIEFSSSSTAANIFVPKNTRFSTNFNGTNFNFYTQQSYIAIRQSNGTYKAECVEIYEGEILEESFFLSNTNKHIILSNTNTDISSIRVFVGFIDKENIGDEFVYTKDIFGIRPDSKVFYLQRGFDSRYELYFGENRFGLQPTINQEIRIGYRITNGAAANGASRFTSTLSGAKITVRTRAAGGSDRETLEDIKFFAPKSIQIQERAVTNRDYEILLKQRFNEIKDVSVFGGDELVPPRYGKVAIAVNTDGGLSENSKTIYTTYLRDKTPIGIQPIFIGPKFLYINLTLDVFYNANQTTKSPFELEQNIRNLLESYSEISLNKFGSVFELSRVSAQIDNSDAAIQNNTMVATPYILYSPRRNIKDNPTFAFGSPLMSPCRFATANKSEVYDRIVSSSPFIFDGISCIFEDNGLGVINILNSRDRLQGNIEIVKRNAGIVNYNTGEIKLIDFITEDYTGNGIRVIAITVEKNVTAPKDQVLILRPEDISITMKDINR